MSFRFNETLLDLLAKLSPEWSKSYKKYPKKSYLPLFPDAALLGAAAPRTPPEAFVRTPRRSRQPHREHRECRRHRECQSRRERFQGDAARRTSAAPPTTTGRRPRRTRRRPIRHLTGSDRRAKSGPPPASDPPRTARLRPQPPAAATGVPSRGADRPTYRAAARFPAPTPICPADRTAASPTRPAADRIGRRRTPARHPAGPAHRAIRRRTYRTPALRKHSAAECRDFAHPHGTKKSPGAAFAAPGRIRFRFGRYAFEPS